MSNFDWRAEDDISWDEYVTDGSDGEQPDPKRKRPLWLIALVAIAIILSAGYIAFRQIRRYVENTAASVEEDVLSSHALIKLAAQEGDLELFAPLLSGRDPNWTQDQLTILDMDLLFNRQPFGLIWQPEETGDDIVVTLSSDLQSAEVEYSETYGYGLNGEEGNIQLTQTAVYRLSETRWLLSPPDNDFWGNYITAKGSYITLTFPERDDEIGSQLASDLESALAGACRSLQLDCNNNEPLDVLLATDLEAMMGTNKPDLFAQEGAQLVLPTPTLVGKPANSASYRALYRGYAAFLVSRLVARQAAWQCCDQSPFFKAMIDVQLQQLGLQTWPLTPADYRHALRQPLDVDIIWAIRTEELSLAEFRERPNWQTLYLFVEFVVNGPDAPSVIDLQRIMARTASLNAWITIAGITGDLNLVEEDWRDAVHQQIINQQTQPPVDWPEENIALICNDGQTGMTNVYRYNPAQNSWTVEMADRDFVVMNSLPNNQGLILTEQYLDVDRLRTTLWRNGQEIVVSFGNDFFFSAQHFDPNGRYIVINHFQQGTVNASDFSAGLYLLELDNCQVDDCQLLQIDWMPIWSPDGSRTLWSVPDTSDGQIFLGDSTAQSGEAVTTGFSPFWLNNESFAYFVDPATPILMTADIQDPTPSQLLETADLAALLPDLDPADLDLLSATTNPHDPGLIYIIAADQVQNTDYLITLNWQTGQLDLALTSEQSFQALTIHSFSPENQWLALSTYISSPNSVNNEVHEELILYNLETGETEQYFLDNLLVTKEGWSNNGRWLVSIDRGFLMLSAPEAGYDHLVRHDFRDCTGVAWIK